MISPPFSETWPPLAGGLLGMLLLGIGFLAALPANAASSSNAGPSGIFNVREYGATGDGKTHDTDAIHRAIRACSAAGGGQVLFPPGRYLTGTVQLQSHLTLKFDAGATLVGSPDLESYRHFTPPKGTPEAKFNPHWHRALILGVDVEDVSLIGPGMIDGNRVFDPKGEEKMRGPHTILFGLSKNVTIRDLSIKASANYAVMLEGVDEVEVRGIKVTGGWDGVHFRGWKDRPCRRVSILDSQFYTGDDAIAGRYWEDTLIANCVLNSSCNAIRLIGPATRLIIHDCLMYGPGLYEHRTSGRTNMLAGVNLQPGAWDPTEGDLDDVLISNVTMKNVSTPLHLSLKPGNTAGRITMTRVSATGIYRAACSIESWAETPIRQVVFRDVTLEFTGGGTKEQASMDVKAPGVDARPLPAWGVYVRHVKQLQLDDVRLHLEKPDLRPVLMADRVENLSLDGFRYPEPDPGTEPFKWVDVGKVQLRDVIPDSLLKGESE